jgi:hypothetical protein
MNFLSKRIGLRVLKKLSVLHNPATVSKLPTTVRPLCQILLCKVSKLTISVAVPSQPRDSQILRPPELISSRILLRFRTCFSPNQA